MALTTGGNVYTWGCNTWNNLGINETSSQLYRSLTPVEVVGVGGTGHLSGIDQISSRGVQCLAFSASAGNVIYGWGSDVYGCLGQPYTNNNTTIPYIAAPIQVYVIGAGSGSGIGDEGVMIGAGMCASIIKMPDSSIGVFGTSFGTTTSQGNIIHFWGLHDVSDISAGSAFYIMGPPRTATTTVVTSSVPSPSNWGQDVTFTATVTPTGSYTPTGQLNFGLNGSPTGSLSTTLDAGAQSTYTIPGSWMQGGNNSIPAQYLGDYNNAPSTAPAFTQTVTKLNATVTFTAAPNPSAAGQTVTFTITAAGPAGDPKPTGYVSFTNGDGGSVLLNNGTATITLSTLTTGSTHFTAVYNGDSNYSSAQSVDAVQVVTLNTSHIALLSSKNPATTGDNITFNISVSGSAGTPTGSAVLYDGDNTLTTLTLDGSGNASYSTTGLASGNHTIVAHYNGDGNYNSSDSGSLQQSVNAPGSQVVTFPDSRLEAVIRNALDKPTGDIHVSDLAALTVLNGYGQSIANLTGLQYCTGLTNLNLNSNQITDISQLASLTNLTLLDIQRNQITDVSPLSSLVHLTYVELDDNNITDMAPLTALVNLTELDLNYNQIVTIPDISGLTQLQTLYLADNQIQDISNITSLSSSVISSLLLTGDPLGNNTLNPAPDFSNLANLYYLGLDRTSLKTMPGLSGLVNLAYLDLSNNQITVISDLSGLTRLNHLYLSNNYLTDISPLANLTSFYTGGELDVSYNYLTVTEGSPAMVIINSFTSKGVTVTYSPQNSAPALLVVSTIVLPDSYVNGPYNFTLSATGGAGNNAWTVSAGTLPTGLLLSASGVISGTPTVNGKYNFTVHAADPLSNSATQNLTININGSGNVYDWGSNVYGQLGNSSNTDITSGATPLSGMTGVVEVSAGAFFTLVLKSDGTVWSFGDNSNGQLGNDTTNSSNVPVQVLGPLGQGYLSNVIAISAGAHLGVALKSDGTVWDWGINSVNSLGSLGDGTYNDSYVPVQVRDPANDGYLTGIVAIASGGASFNMALKSDGTVYAWGYGGNGELGNNGKANSNLPVQVLGPLGTGYLSNILAIAAGNDQCLALKSNGTVWAWGDDGEGQDGDNSPGTSANLVPVQVSGLTGITAVAGGDDNSMALKSDGTVWTWGDNSFGELGNGSITPGISYVPVQATSLSGVFISIASFWRHNMALKSNGTVWAWGDNSGGGLGVPTTSVAHSNQALQVPGIAGGAIAISAGYNVGAAIVIPLSSDSALLSLTISSGTLTPAFDSTKITYTDSVANSITTMTVVPTVHQANATITVNGSPVASGATSGSLSLNNVAPGTNIITVEVTAQDATITTYTITVTRAAAGQSTAAEITAYSLPGQTGASTIVSGASGTIAVTVPYGTSVSALVAAFTASANITSIKVGGTAQLSGATSNNFTTPVTYVVTAQDETTTKNWVVTVTVAPSNAAEITAYDITGQVGSSTITSGASGTIGVTMPFGTNVNGLVAAFTASANITSIKVSGTAQLSGATSNNFTTPVTYVVTAQDGTTTKNWVVTVTVQPPPSTTTTPTTTTTTVNPPSLSRDATLRNLTVSTGTISPVFNSGTTSYTDIVLNSVSSVTVTPTVNQANATVTVNGVAVSSGTASGSINLNVGDNTITLIVTAQDGSTRAGYMVTVTRASNDATLINLTISAGTLTPAFAAGTTGYTDGVAYAVTPVTVTPTVNESHATVKVNGASVTSGSASGAISLNVGANTITIVVTAQDGITTDTYNITVNMALLTTTPITTVVVTVTAPNTTTTPTTTTPITSTPTTTTLPPGTTNLSSDVNSTGTFTSSASASSASGDVTINIPAGVTGLTAGGAPLTQITIVPITTDLPALPSDGAAVGLYFDIQPSGSTFSSPITITVSYDPSLIPAGSDPYVAWYNPATGQWEKLTTISIDTVNHTITASVNHFSTFAVLAALSKTSTTTSTAAGTATNSTKTTATTVTAATKPTANGVIIGVIIGAVILIGLILFFIIRGRKPRGG